MISAERYDAVFDRACKELSIEDKDLNQDDYSRIVKRIPLRLLVAVIEEKVELDSAVWIESWLIEVREEITRRAIEDILLAEEPGS